MLATCVNASVSFSLELGMHGAAFCEHSLEAPWKTNDETFSEMLETSVRLRLITPDSCIPYFLLNVLVVLFL